MRGFAFSLLSSTAGPCSGYTKYAVKKWPCVFKKKYDDTFGKLRREKIDTAFKGKNVYWYFGIQ